MPAGFDHVVGCLGQSRTRRWIVPIAASRLRRQQGRMHVPVLRGPAEADPLGRLEEAAQLQLAQGILDDAGIAQWRSAPAQDVLAGVDRRLAHPAQVPGELDGGCLLPVTRHRERASGHGQEEVGHQADRALGILAGNRDRPLALADRFGDSEHRADAPRLLGATDVDVAQAIAEIVETGVEGAAGAIEHSARLVRQRDRVVILAGRVAAARADQVNRQLAQEIRGTGLAGQLVDGRHIGVGPEEAGAQPIPLRDVADRLRVERGQNGQQERRHHDEPGLQLDRVARPVESLQQDRPAPVTLAGHQPRQHAAEFGRQQRAAARVVLQFVDEARARGVAQDQRGPGGGFVLIEIGGEGTALQDTLHRARGLARLMRRQLLRAHRGARGARAMADDRSFRVLKRVLGDLDHGAAAGAGPAHHRHEQRERLGLRGRQSDPPAIADRAGEGGEHGGADIGGAEMLRVREAADQRLYGRGEILERKRRRRRQLPLHERQIGRDPVRADPISAGRGIGLRLGRGALLRHDDAFRTRPTACGRHPIYRPPKPDESRDPPHNPTPALSPHDRAWTWANVGYGWRRDTKVSSRLGHELARQG